MFMNLKINSYISIKQNCVILFKKIKTHFGLRDHHQDIITKIQTITYNAVLIKLVIWDPIRLTQNSHKTMCI